MQVVTPHSGLPMSNSQISHIFLKSRYLVIDAKINLPDTWQKITVRKLLERCAGRH